MADLPVLVLNEIFKLLNIRDRQRVRSVCKEWKFIIETMPHQRALCIYSKDYPYGEKWCFSEEPVIEPDMLYIKFARTALKFDLKNKLFQSLQKLCLWQIGERVDNLLEEVNLLANLKVLMICEDRMNCRVLSSSSIERLSLQCYSFNDTELDTPNLSSLILRDYNSTHSETITHPLSFRFPLSIRYLQCWKFDRTLSVLKNLETLVCKRIDCEFELNDFKSLVRLELFPLADYEQPKITRIWQERERLKRSDLEVIVSGFKENPIICHLGTEICFEFETLFKGTEPGKRSRYLEHVAKYRTDLVGHLPWRLHLHIENLPKHVDLIASDLFRKKFNFYAFSTIYKLYAFEATPEVAIVDPFDLIHLLKRNDVKKVSLSSLKQFKKKFYQQICTIQSIKELDLEVHLEDFEFGWFVNLQNLMILELRTKKISFQFIGQLFEKLKFFNKFKFRCQTFAIVCYVDRLRPESLSVEDYIFPYKFLSWEPYNLNAKGDQNFYYQVKELNELIPVIKEEERRLKEHEEVKDLLI